MWATPLVASRAGALALLMGLALPMGLAIGGAAQALPLFEEPALQSPKAARLAMLAVARAGDRLVSVGERGVILLSVDQGRQWRQVPSPVRVSLTAVHFVDARQGWAVGHQGVILHSSDGGEHWTRQLDGARLIQLIQASADAADERAREAARRLASEGFDKPFFDVCFVDELRGVAVGAYGIAVATEDGGQTWTPLDLSAVNPRGRHLYAARMTPRGQVYLAGEQGLLLSSAGPGQPFAVLASPYKGSFFGLLLTRSGGLLAHGLRGHAFESGDGGQSWSALEVGTPVTLSAGAQAADGAIVLLGQSGELHRRAETGRGFEPLASGQPLPAAGLAQAADGGWVIATLRGMRRVAEP